MEKIISTLERHLDETEKFILKCPPEKLAAKPQKNKWSKKEILGHLVDSGINNLQRFTEIQYAAKPYPIRKYDQDALVKANHYQDSDINEILHCWLAINKRIIKVIATQTNEALNYQVVIVKDQNSDLRFLIEDYVNHMKHHLNQIMC